MWHIHRFSLSSSFFCPSLHFSSPSNGLLFTSSILQQAESKGSTSLSENCCTFNQARIFSSALWDHVFPPLLTQGLEASWARSSSSSSSCPSLVGSALKTEVLFSLPPSSRPLAIPTHDPKAKDAMDQQQLFHSSCMWLGQQPSCPAHPACTSLSQASPRPLDCTPSLGRGLAGAGGLPQSHRAAPAEPSYHAGLAQLLQAKLLVLLYKNLTKLPLMDFMELHQMLLTWSCSKKPPL